jgi:hypothetical protein
VNEREEALRRLRRDNARLREEREISKGSDLRRAGEAISGLRVL